MAEKAGELAIKHDCKERGGDWHENLDLCVVPDVDYMIDIDKLECTCESTHGFPLKCTCEATTDKENVGTITISDLDITEEVEDVDLGLEKV